MEKPIKMAHRLLTEIISQDDVVVDATMGNGHDTEFLARLTNFVYAFDIQDQAIIATRHRLDKTKLMACLIHDGHENIDVYITEPVRAAIFNLGYLPGSDKCIVTAPDTTITALEKICKLLVVGGRIAIMVYSGHDIAESIAIDDWAKNLSQTEWDVIRYQYVNKINNPPYLICIQKI